MYINMAMFELTGLNIYWTRITKGHFFCKFRLKNRISKMGILASTVFAIMNAVKLHVLHVKTILELDMFDLYTITGVFEFMQCCFDS